MATRSEGEAADYLQKHNFMELLQDLASMLFFYRPGWSLFILCSLQAAKQTLKVLNCIHNQNSPF
uniref:Uncharacterized protein n=1 Tax=Dicentrarchus labrax TaxID=13489 RepID=A0A8P4KPL6_DICLA